MEKKAPERKTQRRREHTPPAITQHSAGVIHLPLRFCWYPPVPLVLAHGRTRRRGVQGKDNPRERT
eukprot:9856095-Prorocentrum_lima.AAC.1